MSANVRGDDEEDPAHAPAGVRVAGMPPTTKPLVLIRHGKSSAQGARSRSSDWALRDAALALAGVRQAESLRELVRAVVAEAGAGAMTMDLVAVSPLTRALQTALIAFSPNAAAAATTTTTTTTTKMNVVVVPELAEFNARGARAIPENVGRPLAELLRDPLLAGVEEWDLSLVRAAAWPHGDEPTRGSKRKREMPWERVQTALAALAARPERRIVVVGHCNWILSALEFALDYVENAEPLHAEMVVRADGKIAVRLLKEDEEHEWFSVAPRGSG